MGSAAEPAGSLTPRLPLFSVPLMQSTEPSGMLTPPFHSSAAVPFRWEEEPGKPRPCTALANISDFATKCLELPPRLLSSDTKLTSPTTVLDGPYAGTRSKFQSSSFRISRECYGSFSHERAQLGAPTPLSLSKRRGWLGSWGRRAFKSKKEVGGFSHVFPSTLDKESDCGTTAGESNNKKGKMTKIKRAGSLSNLSHARSHFWVSITSFFFFFFFWLLAQFCIYFSGLDLGKNRAVYNFLRRKKYCKMWLIVSKALYEMQDIMLQSNKVGP
jgi:hypothetical protein